MAFLSISIDICGSTYAKAKLREHAGLIDSEATSLYEGFQKQVLRVEETFWFLLRSKELDIERLFLIKTIGDELWYSYDLEGLHEFETHAAMAKMIDVLVGLHIKSFNLVAGSEEEPYDWKNVNPENLLRIELPLKITIDMISDAFEMNELREKYLKPYIAELLSPFDRPSQRHVQEGDVDFNNLCNRLGVAHQVLTSEKVHTVIRHDFIGWEIDRFFRLTKEALECTVLIGPAILEVFDKHELIAANKSEKPDVEDGMWVMSEPMIRVRHGDVSFTSIQNIILARRTVPAKALKGIGADCDIAIVSWKYQEGVDLKKVTQTSECSS